jgi:hypothetical protein
MNQRVLSNAKTRKSLLPKKAALAIAMLMTFSSGAGAFSDGPALVQRLVVMGKEIAEYKAQLDQMKQQYENLQKNLIPGGGINFTLIKQQDSLKRRGDDEGMDIACPGAGGLGLDALKSALSINPNGKIKEQQKAICQRIVLAQNAQYNESVKVLEGVRDREAELKQINDERKAIKDEPGKLQENTNKLNAVLNKATIEMQYSTAVIAAYDSYINALQQSQSQLGKQALTGDSGNKTFVENITTKFVQGVVLEGALQTARSRER